MSIDLAQIAIAAALNKNWEEAISTNQNIIKTDKKDVEALNRLGRAYMEIGKTIDSKKIFDEVLRIDQYNQIALKNIRLLLTKKNGVSSSRCPIDPGLFLEEPGKTKITSLVEPASKEALFTLSVGDELKLVPKKRFIVVTTTNDVYLGKLADDLSQRLITFIKKGNKYLTYIKSVSPTEIKVFVRETERAKKLADQPTFPPQEIYYQAFIPPDLVHESRPVILDSEEGEESGIEETEEKPEEEKSEGEADL